MEETPPRQQVGRIGHVHHRRQHATGGTVRIGWGGAPADLNPGIGVLVEDYILYNLVYDALLNIDLEGNFQPKVASDWSVSDDGLTWTLTIRDDIKFHDGTPLTARRRGLQPHPVSGTRPTFHICPPI